MERVKIDAILREKVGKETAKKVRFKGNVPAVVYGKDINLSVQIPKESIKTLNSIHFSQGAVIDMALSGADKKESLSVLIKEVQYNPLTDAVIHLDFVKISLEKKIRVHVPVALKGEPKGLKDEGILEQILWQLTVEALPLDIPEKIEIEVSHLDIGDSVHVKDIKVADNVRIITSAEETVATVVEHKEEVVAPEAAEAAPTGPEVIKEKKEAPVTEGGKGAKPAKEEAKSKEEPKGKDSEKGKK